MSVLCSQYYVGYRQLHFSWQLDHKLKALGTSLGISCKLFYSFSFQHVCMIRIFKPKYIAKQGVWYGCMKNIMFPCMNWAWSFILSYCWLFTDLPPPSSWPAYHLLIDNSYFSHILIALWFYSFFFGIRVIPEVENV